MAASNPEILCHQSKILEQSSPEPKRFPFHKLTADLRFLLVADIESQDLPKYTKSRWEKSRLCRTSFKLVWKTQNNGPSDWNGLFLVSFGPAPQQWIGKETKRWAEIQYEEGEGFKEQPEKTVCRVLLLVNS